MSRLSIEELSESITGKRCPLKGKRPQEGKYGCAYCGMNHSTFVDAFDCCAPGIREHERKHGPLKELGLNRTL